MEQASPWDKALLALRMVALDPGLGGIALRARAGPVRSAFLDAVAQHLPHARKIHPGIDDDQLFGGIDLNTTLATGTLQMRDGLADQGNALILTMAERAPASLAARLALLLDRADAPPLLALDEGADPDEGTPPGLLERLAFQINLDGLTLADTVGGSPHPTDTPRAVTVSDAQIEQLARVSTALGVASPRALCLALRAARVHAQLNNRSTMTEDDLEAAVILVLVPRATQIPADDADQPDQPPPPPETSDTDDTQTSDPALSDDMLIEAAKALLPADLLDRLSAKSPQRAKGAGAGAKQTGNRRGRPLPARPGRPSSQARIDIIATLRHAAPWQRLRRTAQPDRPGVLVRSGDIHIKRSEARSDRLLIFAVDASGSAAMTRLAEAKGAVELMLASAYARRDHVALIGFRRTGAEVLLPPTRSLVRTKRQLAALPGGGGTPLASGLQVALKLAQTAQSRGMTPTIALLTDGRANVALDGSPGRDQAAQDARTMAQALRHQGIAAVVIDMGNRPEPGLSDLALAMDATYLALPRADARRISNAVTATLGR